MLCHNFFLQKYIKCVFWVWPKRWHIRSIYVYICKVAAARANTALKWWMKFVLAKIEIYRKLSGQKYGLCAIKWFHMRDIIYVFYLWCVCGIGSWRTQNFHPWSCVKFFGGKSAAGIEKKIRDYFQTLSSVYLPQFFFSIFVSRIFEEPFSISAYQNMLCST